jgi:hypothetical protein
MTVAATLPRTEPILAGPRVHTTWLGTTKFTCIQPNCDGVHHLYCSCSCNAH